MRILNFPINDLKLVLHLLKNRGGNITTRVRFNSYPRANISRPDVEKNTNNDISRVSNGLASAVWNACNANARRNCYPRPACLKGGLKYLKGLEKMGANIRIIDDHRAEIIGGTQLHRR